MKNKLFWIWVAVEVAGATWFGWQIAKAQAKPWARKPKRKSKRNPAAWWTTGKISDQTFASPRGVARKNIGAIF